MPRKKRDNNTHLRVTKLACRKALLESGIQIIFNNLNCLDIRILKYNHVRYHFRLLGITEITSQEMSDLWRYLDNIEGVRLDKDGVELICSSDPDPEDE